MSFWAWGQRNSWCREKPVILRLRQSNVGVSFTVCSEFCAVRRGGGGCKHDTNILDNSETTWKATFKSCNCKFTIIQTTTILKSCTSWCGDSQTWERQYPPKWRKNRLWERLIDYRKNTSKTSGSSNFPKFIFEAIESRSILSVFRCFSITPHTNRV
jgi:hypothetical protein